LNLNGLPGLILEVETFFNTITIESISYSDNTQLLDAEMNELKKQFTSEKEGYEIKESILMLKKAQLIDQLKMMR
jgi:GLPGLI family protein